MIKKISLATLAVVSVSAVAFGVTTTFSDVPSDHWAADSISWNAEMGIMSGPGDMPGMFDPAGVVNRAQLATVNKRMYDKLNNKMMMLESKVESLEDNLEALDKDVKNVSDIPEEDTTEDEEVMLDNITDLAVATDDLSTLVSALVAAELEDDLADEGSTFTVFAPTNDAFADIQETVDDLLMEENQSELVAVLLNHVVAGEFMAADLEDGDVLTTLSGEELTVSIMDGKVMVEGVEVVIPDVEASNGVVHVVDTVIVP